MARTFTPATGVRTYLVKDFIEQAYMMVGLLAEQQTPQYTDVAVTQLNYVLQDLSNSQELLFQYRRMLLAPTINQRQLVLPVQTIDIRYANYVYQTIPVPATALPADIATASNAFDRNLDGPPFVATLAENWIGGYYGVDFPNGFKVDHVAVCPSGDFVFNLVVEYSNDGITWQTLTTLPTQTIEDRTWYYFPLDGAGLYTYWRLRETGKVAMQLRQAVFAISSYTIPFYRMNKDEYWSLTNRQTQNVGTRPLQYWFDRQIDPIFNIWPIAQDDFQVFEFLLESAIQDVAFGDTLPMPNRWVQYIQSMLAARLAMVLPSVDQSRLLTLNQLAASQFQVALGQERDKSGVYLRPAIYPYTQI